MQLYMVVTERDSDGDLNTYFPQITADINHIARCVTKKESDTKTIYRVFKIPSMEEVNIESIKLIVVGL